MWFNNALIYQCKLEKEEDLSSLLTPERLKPCPPHARFIYGWHHVIADELVQNIAGCSLICMGKEERILPRGVIKRLLAERIQTLEAQGRTVKRSEKAQLAEELEFELLPKSFCLQKRLLAILDYTSHRLIINSASVNQASQLISLLRKSVPGVHIEPLKAIDQLSMRFAHWINTPSLLPSNFQLASDCLLFAPQDEKKRFHCKGYELPAEEVLSLLSQGLVVAEISLIWNDRIQFTLTQDLTLKRLKCLDYLVDEFNEIRKLDEEYQQQDAALTLLAGELRSLVSELFGEVSDNLTPLTEAASPLGRAQSFVE